MRTFGVFWLIFVCGGRCFADYYATSNYFCRNLNRQTIVDISQLEGIWYLIEKIVHTDERHHKINLTTCPVIHISEVRNTTTYTPLHKTYDTTYGAGYPHVPENVQNHRNPTDPSSTFDNEQDFVKQTEEYDRRTTYDYDRRKNLYSIYMKRHSGMKHLKMYVSDDDNSVEHQLRYNVTNPGFWIHSGPREGTQENLKHFAGVTQVLKAVGNHLVLTTCQSNKDVKELYTLILSRENYLKSWDVQRIHAMLIQQSLSTNFIERTCNDAASNRYRNLPELTRTPVEKKVEYITRYSPEGRLVYSNKDDEEKLKKTYSRYTTPNYKELKEKHWIYIKPLYEIRYLRMYWDEGTHSTEYRLRYGADQPGFWISYGFEKGQGRLNRFAGTVQVMKAVGNHLVLTFCYSLPETKQFFTVILSRRDFMDHKDIQSIHRLLTYQGLRVGEVETSCNGANFIRLCLSLFILGFVLLFY